MKFDDSLTEQLSRIADEPAPPSAVDLERAVAAGRRTMTARRTAGAASGTAAVAIVAALCVTILSGGGRAPAVTRQKPTASPSATAALSGTDPLTVPAAFGALPSGFAFTQVQTQPSVPELLTVADAAVGQSATLMITPAGQSPVPPVNGDGPATKVTAPPVGQDPAFWYYAPGSTEAAENGFVRLNWEYASNQWASLDFSSAATGTAITGVIYQLAESVRFGAATAYPLPMHFTPPTGLPFMHAGYTLSASGGWSATLIYGVEDTPSQAGSELLISVQGIGPGAGGGSAPAGAVVSEQPSHPSGPSPYPTIDGCAVDVGTGTNVELWIPECHGLEIDISAYEGAVQALAQYGGIEGFFRSFIWLGPNPASWTTHIVG